MVKTKPPRSFCRSSKTLEVLHGGLCIIQREAREGYFFENKWRTCGWHGIWWHDLWHWAFKPEGSVITTWSIAGSLSSLRLWTPSASSPSASKPTCCAACMRPSKVVPCLEVPLSLRRFSKLLSPWWNLMMEARHATPQSDWSCWRTKLLATAFMEGILKWLLSWSRP